MKKIRNIVAQVAVAVTMLLTPAVVFARGRGGHVGRSELFEAQSRALDNIEFALNIMLIISSLMLVGMLVYLCYDIFKIIKKRKTSKPNHT